MKEVEALKKRVKSEVMNAEHVLIRDGECRVYESLGYKIYVVDNLVTIQVMEGVSNTAEVKFWSDEDLIEKFK